MVRSQLLYCTQVWRPHLMKDILIIEQIQCHPTKYTQNLLKLKILPLMYMFKLQDLLFAIKSIKSRTSQFNIQGYINFSSTSTRSGTSNKLVIPWHLNNISTFIDCQLFGMPCPPLILIYHFICSNLNSKFFSGIILRRNFDGNNNCTLATLSLPLLQLPFVAPSTWTIVCIYK